MRAMLLVMVASVAGACVVDEPAESDASWSEAEPEIEIEARAEPDIEPIVWRPSCHSHYEDCQKTKLSKEDDYGTSRCQTCADLCEIRDGEWPKQTNGGKDCQYWRRKYQYSRAAPAERSP